MTIRVTKDNATQYITRVKHRLPKNIRRGAWRFTKFLAEKLSVEAPTGAYGYLKRTLAVPHRLGANNWVIKAPFYLFHLEKGTRPHWIPKIRKTETWAAKHGMSFSTMRHIIRRKGTRKSKFQTEKILVQSIRDFKTRLNVHVDRGLR